MYCTYRQYTWHFNSKGMHQTKRHRVWGMGMEDFVVLWVRGFSGDSHGFFCGYEMGIRIEIQSPRQPWQIYHSVAVLQVTCLPKYRNPVQFRESHCLKVEIQHKYVHKTIYYWHYAPNVISFRYIVDVCFVSGFQFLQRAAMLALQALY